MDALIKLEADLISDAARDLARAYDLVRHRHGERFRALEKRLADLEQLDPQPIIHTLTCGDSIVLIAAPPVEWTALLAEAKQLEVI